MERKYANILTVWNLGDRIVGVLFGSLHSFQLSKFPASDRRKLLLY